jgi:uncharacterized protein YukJ
MPLTGYGVLKAKPLKIRPFELELNENGKPETHLQILVEANNQNYRIAIDVYSQAEPPELRYAIFNNFQNPGFTGRLLKLNQGITLKEEGLDTVLDYQRDHLFDFHDMKTAHVIGKGANELADYLDLYIEKAIASKDAMIYAFGQTWGPEEKKDQYFDFTSWGIHDIHMNQGNAGKWEKENGTGQDGGFFIHIPNEKEGRWIAVFLAFQSQSFCTDESGNPKANPELPADLSVAIAAALLNPCKKGDLPTVSLINRSKIEVNLTGRYLSNDGGKTRVSLEGQTIPPGDILKVGFPNRLSDNGGIIGLYKDEVNKLHEVSYAIDDYALAGCTTVF